MEHNCVNGVSEDKINIIIDWASLPFAGYTAWSSVQDKKDTGVKFLFKLSDEILDEAIKEGEYGEGIMTAEFFLPPENDYPGLREQWDDQHYIQYHIRLIDSTEVNGWLSKEELDGDKLPEAICHLKAFVNPTAVIDRIAQQLCPPLPPRQ